MTISTRGRPIVTALTAILIVAALGTTAALFSPRVQQTIFDRGADEVDAATRVIRLLTDYAHPGFLRAHPALNHRLEALGGVLEAESRALIQEFFRERRNGALSGEVPKWS